MRNEYRGMEWGNFSVFRYSEGNSYPWEVVASDETWKEDEMNDVEFLEILKVTKTIAELNKYIHIEEEVVLTDEEINVYKQKFKIKGD